MAFIPNTQPGLIDGESLSRNPHECVSPPVRQEQGQREELGRDHMSALAAEDHHGHGQCLEEFVAAIRRLAEADGIAVAAGVFDTDAWEADWADGLSPSQAWAEERACIEEHREYVLQRALTLSER